MNYWTGTEGRQFEQEVADWADSNYAIALGNAGATSIFADIDAMTGNLTVETIVVVTRDIPLGAIVVSNPTRLFNK